MIFRKIMKNYIEKYGATILGNLLWPPVSSAVLAEGEHNDILALDTGDHYKLPGGLINSGEDMREAAKREALEETGFNVEIGDLLDVRVGDQTGSITFFFEGKVIDGEKDGSWEGRPEFIDKEEMKDKMWKLEHSHVHEYLFPNSE
ncbi:NUDIX domain-containing protein [Candidatus Nanohalovita haloferacivicina]|uniref:NUDIX domain-containing protein n=1 Tax=Candidatus Nanohalovita haloferacivicina TaxID=2978046 RepID=UPI00325FA0A4|nr:8-oxo-dGTP diphosphatase [Candidatus Nanohalobia archaeon BNXNv]